MAGIPLPNTGDNGPQPGNGANPQAPSFAQDAQGATSWIGSLVSGLMSPFYTIFDVIGNNIIYGALAIAGGYLMFRGWHLVAAEVGGGAVSAELKDIVTKPAKLTGQVGLAVATRGMSTAKFAAKVPGKVKTWGIERSSFAGKHAARPAPTGGRHAA